ncbi:polymer-forming cytoskeletal protein, partial [Lujinxingia vulgaris]
MADPTIIGAQTQVSGRVSGDADLRVEGRVDGTIELSETLTIAQGGVVTGTVKARQVVIEGVLDGEVSAEERVVLSATARAVANILAPLVEMADGAQLRGELNIGVDAEAPTAARTPARTSQPTRSAPASTATASAASRSSAPARTAPASAP